jgi:hypothetical protein
MTPRLVTFRKEDGAALQGLGNRVEIGHIPQGSYTKPLRRRRAPPWERRRPRRLLFNGPRPHPSSPRHDHPNRPPRGPSPPADQTSAFPRGGGALTPVASPNTSPNVFLSGLISFYLNVDPFPIPCPRREVSVEQGVKLPLLQGLPLFYGLSRGRPGTPVR